MEVEIVATDDEQPEVARTARLVREVAQQLGVRVVPEGKARLANGRTVVRIFDRRQFIGVPLIQPEECAVHLLEVAAGENGPICLVSVNVARLVSDEWSGGVFQGIGGANSFIL